MNVIDKVLESMICCNDQGKRNGIVASEISEDLIADLYKLKDRAGSK